MLACMNRLIKSRMLANMLAIPVLSRSALRMVKLKVGISWGSSRPLVWQPHNKINKLDVRKLHFLVIFHSFIYIFYLCVYIYIQLYIYIYFSIYLYMPERTKNLQFFFSSLTDKDGKFTIGRRLPMGPVCFPYLQWLTPDLQPQGD